jgi:hypothetical protein
MLEVAKGVQRHPAAGEVFEVHFTSGGGEFEPLIETRSFPRSRVITKLNSLIDRLFDAGS